MAAAAASVDEQSLLQVESGSVETQVPSLGAGVRHHRSAAVATVTALLGCAAFAAVALASRSGIVLPPTTAPASSPVKVGNLPQIGTVQLWSQPKECGGTQCDCGWASAPGICNNQFEQSACFQCCCGGGGLASPSFVSTPSFRLPSHDRREEFQHAAGPGYAARGENEMGYNSRSMLSNSYDSGYSQHQEVYDHDSYHHITHHHSSSPMIMLMFGVMTMMLAVLACVGIYIFFKPQPSF